MTITFNHKGFTSDELREAFANIADPDDWRGPIALTVPGEQVGITVASIEFMTATNPSVMMIQGKDGDTFIEFLIRSEGYRAGPAGP